MRTYEFITKSQENTASDMLSCKRVFQMHIVFNIKAFIGLQIWWISSYILERTPKTGQTTVMAKQALRLLSNFFSCSTKLSMKFQPLIKANMLKNKDILAFRQSYFIFIMLINVTQTIIA